VQPTPDPLTERGRWRRPSHGGMADGRTRAAKRWRAIHDSFRAQLRPGATGVTQDALCKSLATVTLALEQMAAQQAQGAPVDTERLVALANLQGRLLERLGLTAPAPQSEPDPVAAHRKRMGWAP